MVQKTQSTRPRRWWPGAVLFAAIVLALVGGSAWWLRGRTLWTDDRGLAVTDEQARLRQVLWSEPAGLGEPLNSPDQEYEPALAPDGVELYFVRGLPGRGADIVVSYRRQGRWTDPAPVAAINGEQDDLGPRLTADGRWLLFYSNRPGGHGGFDVWASRRETTGWDRPVNLGPEINGPHDDYGAAVDLANRRLYFSSNRKSASKHEGEQWPATIRRGEAGDFDLFVVDLSPPAATQPDATAAPTTQPEELTAAGPARELTDLNTPYNEGAPCLSGDGAFLYFASNRPGGLGGFDLYRCRLSAEGEPGQVEDLGPQVNTAANETDPQLALGGFRLLFSSDRDGGRGGYDLFDAESREVYALRQGRPLPALGWSWWVLLIGATGLLLMTLLFRSIGYHQLNLLQKCLAVSLMVHLLLMVLLGAWRFSQVFIEYVAREGGLEVAVNLDLGREMDVRTRLRQQITDTPLPEPSLAQPVPVEVEPTPEPAPMPAELNVPRAAVQPAPMAVQPDAPKVLPPRPAESIHLPPPPELAEQPRIELASLQGLRQDEPDLRPPTPPLQMSEMRQPQPPAERPSEIPLRPEAARMQARPAPEPPAPAQPPRPSAETIAIQPPPAPPNEVDVNAPAVAAQPVARQSDERIAVAEPVVQALPREVQPPIERPREIRVQPDAAHTVARPAAMPVSPAGRATPQIEPAAIEPAVQTPQPVDVAAPAVAVAPVSAVPPERIAVAEPPVRTEPQAAPGERGARPVIAAPAVAVAQAEVRPLAAAVEPDRAAPPVEPVQVQTPKPATVLVPPEVAGPNVRAPRPTSPPAPRGPVVAEPEVKPQPQPAASPQGQPTLAQTAVPTARPDPRSLAVAADVREARPAPAMPVAIDVPTVADSVNVALPVLASLPRTDDKPLLATPVEPTQPLRPEPLSAVSADRPSEMIEAVRAAASSEPAEASLADRPTASARRPDAADLEAARPRPLPVPIALAGTIEPGELVSPESLFQRSYEQRQKLIDEMGGSKQSEAAVAKALIYLSRTQSKDGRWTDPQTRGNTIRTRTDVSLTGLGLLCFLAADHTPAKAGPYRETTTKAADWLLAQQKEDGDLRGGGDMYGQAIATLALAEAATMTHEARYSRAAVQAAEFIVKAQNPQTGGWRYVPGDPGDTSVLGWQVMALHSVERLGWTLPATTRAGALRWLDRVGRAPDKLLAGYQNASPTPTMTAEAVFSRLLLGRQLTARQIEAVGDYLLANPPNRGQANFYYCYYASLALMQTQGEAWEKWNALMRDHLVKLQQTAAPNAGSWDTNSRWGPRGGRIYTTALATLTLEVYYRYLPMYGRTPPRE